MVLLLLAALPRILRAAAETTKLSSNVNTNIKGMANMKKKRGLI